jgi:hypothetical protein
MPYKVIDSVKVNYNVTGSLDTKKSYDLFMKTFKFGGADRNDVYFDEPNRHVLITYRMNAASLANQLVVDGEREKAIQVLDKVYNGISDRSYPYSYEYSGYFMATAYYRAGDRKKGQEIAEKIKNSSVKTMSWINALDDEGRYSVADVVTQQYQILGGIAQAALQEGDSVYAKSLFNRLEGMQKDPKIMELLRAAGRANQGGGEEE